MTTLGIGTGELIDIGAPMLEDVWSFVGEVLDLEDVTDPMVSFLEETKPDYLERTEGLEAGEMPSVYVTAISYRGGQGFDATRLLFASFELLGRVTTSPATSTTRASRTSSSAASSSWSGTPRSSSSTRVTATWSARTSSRTPSTRS